jgi:hypothetical protein
MSICAPLTPRSPSDWCVAAVTEPFSTQNLNPVLACTLLMPAGRLSRVELRH